MVPEGLGHDRWSPRHCLGSGAPNLYQKKLMEDREKAGLVTPGPANFETIKKSLVEISQRLAAAESDHQQLARRMGGQR
jgi:hypothetical protein